MSESSLTEKVTHTPGPWRVEGLAIYGPFTSTGQQNIGVVITSGGTRASRPRAEADARLIAAAPDMAAFLEVLASDASAYPWHAAVHRLLEPIRGVQ